MISASQALERLRAGNDRYVSDNGTLDRSHGSELREGLAQGQEPFAVVLGCSDSRVPPEMVFDQGPGGLFIVRVVGNVVTPGALGSIEFAVERLGARLVVVLGHTGCGAVQATLEALARPSPTVSPNLAALVDRVRPAVEPLLAAPGETSHETLVARAVRANIGRSVERIAQESPVLEPLILAGEVTVIGAEYSLLTGCVDFLTA